MWQHWQRIIKEEAEKYGYGQEVDIEEAKDPRFPKGFKKGESLWVPPGNDRGELVSWKAGKEPGGTFTVKIFKTGKTVEVSARDIFKANSPKLLSTKEEVEEAYAPLDTKGIVGAFTESTKKKRFEYRNSTDSWVKAMVSCTKSVSLTPAGDSPNGEQPMSREPSATSQSMRVRTASLSWRSGRSATMSSM